MSVPEGGRSSVTILCQFLPTTREGNVLHLSVCSRGGVSVHRQTPPDRDPTLDRSIHSGQRHPRHLVVATAAVGTHPIGKHSSYYNFQYERVIQFFRE